MTTHVIGKRLQRVHALDHLPDLAGRVVLVTGGTDGVGRALVGQLATTRATLLLSARDVAKGERVRDEITRATGNDDLHVVELDLASLASVRSAADVVLTRWSRLDLVIANAAHQAGKERTTTVDGFETTFAVNQLALVLLLDLLEDRLRASAPSRIVVVASEAHRRSKGGLDFDDLMFERASFDPTLAYNRSKLANVIFARDLAGKLEGSGVTVDAAHPGSVDTPMMRANFRSAPMRALYPLLRAGFLVSPDDAAAGLLRVALDPELATSTGHYFEQGRQASPGDAANDTAAAVELAEVTAALLADTSNGPGCS